MGHNEPTRVSIPVTQESITKHIKRRQFSSSVGDDGPTGKEKKKKEEKNTVFFYQESTTKQKEDNFHPQWVTGGTLINSQLG